MSVDGWKNATIESLIADGVIITHKDGNHGSNYPRASEFGKRGVPFITAKLLDDSGNIDIENAPRLNNNKASKFTFGFIQADDVLLSHNATVGRVAVVPMLNERVLIGTSLTLYRLDITRLLPKYLAAYFSGREFQNQLASVMSQTTRNQVPITSQRKLSIVIPPLNEQEKVADILESFDKKIELNRQTNQTLEQIAQAIFKSWFVDFEPVKAKMAAKQAGATAEQIEQAAICTISGKTPEQLAQLDPQTLKQLKTTAALFPDALVDSELGEMPEGWEAKPLGNYLEIKRGGSPRPINEYMVEKGLPWTKIADATAEPSPFLFRTKEFIKEEGLKKTVLLKKGTLILTNSATPGLPKFLELDACIHDGWLHFPNKKLFTDNYLYQLFLDIRKALIAQGNGSVFTNLKTDILRNQVVVVPPQDLIIKFEDTIQLIFMQLKENCKEINVLTELRDSLLPKLLSGEITLANQDEAS
ncbi:restriction endonuclease subunit S [Methylomonas sp. MK1]|uniref:restriction endonuclease subunit S n=1 Tax=Methylomonas sp. MK1 TaxID=1131552 RepID=UPI0003607EDB|nr:restriction endonuclease subunit S [Methylomonas sp. MK1]